MFPRYLITQELPTSFIFRPGWMTVRVWIDSTLVWKTTRDHACQTSPREIGIDGLVITQCKFYTKGTKTETRSDIELAGSCLDGTLCLFVEAMFPNYAMIGSILICLDTRYDQSISIRYVSQARKMKRVCPATDSKRKSRKSQPNHQRVAASPHI